MKKLSFVRGVATAGNVVFNILYVMSILTTVVLLFSTLFLSFLPGGAITVTTDTQVEVKINFGNLLGNVWNHLSQEEKAEFQDQLGEVYEVEGDTATMKTSAPVAVSNRSMALAIIPVMTQMLIMIFLFRYLAKACKAIQTAVYTPFVPAAAQNLKNAGISLFFLAAAPALCAGLITLLTKESSFMGQEINLYTVMGGFALLALSFLFEYAATFTPAPAAPQTPPTPPQEPQPPKENQSGGAF